MGLVSVELLCIRNVRAGGKVEELVVQTVRNTRTDASALGLVPDMSTGTA